MRWRRLPLSVLLPVGLVFLVGWLAVLQYQWLGQVSEAERDQLRTSLTHSASEFADDFDHEISQIYLTLLQVDGEAVAAGNTSNVTDRLTEWRAIARFPELISEVYYARDTEGEFTLRRHAEAEWTDVAWPDDLLEVKTRLEPRRGRRVGGPATAEIVEIALSPVVSQVPALVIPTHRSRPPAMTEFTEVTENVPLRSADTNAIFVGLERDRSALVVTLDAEYLRQAMLPALASRHFPEEGADRYRVSIVDADSAPVLGRGLPDGAIISGSEADVTTPFFGLKLDTGAGYSMGTGRIMAWSVTRSDGTSTRPNLVLPRIEAEAAGQIQVMVDQHLLTPARDESATALHFGTDSWQLRLQHVAGSLDAAVTNARQRNVWLSFGILAMLGMSVGLIVLNARRSERLAAQQMDFVATVSHELRTPLAVIRSAAQNLSAGVVLDDGQARRYGDLIEGEGRRLTDMVEQVLEYAGLSGNRQPLRARPLDIASLVGGVLKTCSPLIEADQFEVSLDMSSDLPPVMADEDALRRALQNLITNAVKYAGEGRWLGIRGRVVKVRGRDEVALEISDRGRGIEAEDLPHIFEPFYRGRYAVDRQIQGNGLGLSLVKRIVEAHDGRLTVKSAAGEGTTFTVHLPAATGERSPHAMPEPAPQPGGRSA